MLASEAIHVSRFTIHAPTIDDSRSPRFTSWIVNIRNNPHQLDHLFFNFETQLLFAMKRLFCCLSLMLVLSTGFAQKQYFIYLQTEGEQSFFVKMNDKVYSSTPAGYLILSQLRDSTYHFRVGFPQNKWPEQQFTVPVKGNDHGFLLKNFGDKGWGLYDLQSLSVQMGNDAASGTVKTEMRPVSAFTEVLSRASNDPSLRERPVQVKSEEKQSVEAQTAIVKETVAPPKQEPVSNPVTTAAKTADTPVNKGADAGIKADTGKAVAAVTQPSATQLPPAKDTIAIAPKEEKAVVTEAVVPEAKKQEVHMGVDTTETKKTEQVTAAIVEQKKKEPVEADTFKRSTVVKRSESSTSEGIGATYIDQGAEGRNDTIRITIPNPKPKSPPAVVTKPAEQKKFLDITTNDKDASTAVPIGSARTTPKARCQSTAGESDFLKLRKKMAAGKNDDAMMTEAKKAFKEKCYSSEQVRNLGNLFLTEPGKFQFYEAAYPTVSDPDRFAPLESEFKDPYFIHRFKSLGK
jgi:hypothetical protein